MVCISQSFFTIGSMSLNGSRHGNFDRPCSTAALIPDTSHPFKHTFLSSFYVISLYISISHFACSGFMLDNFSETSMVSRSLRSFMARVICLAYQSVNFLFISLLTKPFGPPWISRCWKRLVKLAGTDCNKMLLFDQTCKTGLVICPLKTSMINNAAWSFSIPNCSLSFFI